MPDLIIFIWEIIKTWDTADWRNVALIAFGCVGLPLAIWRSIIASKQARLVEAGQDFDRYQKGAAMLGDKRLSVRQAGISALQKLAEKKKSAYLTIVLEVLCSFIRDRSKEERAAVSEEYQDELYVSADCQSAIEAISELNKLRILNANKEKLRVLDLQDVNLYKLKLEGAQFSFLNFAGANLRGVHLKDGDLSHCDLGSADISRSILELVNFNHSYMSKIKVNDAFLYSPDFTNATLSRANFNSTYLTKATFTDVDMNLCKLLDSTLKSTVFRNVFIEEVNLNGAELVDVTLEKLRFDKIFGTTREITVDFHKAKFGVRLVNPL